LIEESDDEDNDRDEDNGDDHADLVDDDDCGYHDKLMIVMCCT